MPTQSIECAFYPRPVLDCALFPGGDRDDELAPAGAAQRLDPLLQLLLACSEGSAPNQLIGDEAAFLRFHKNEMSAVVVEVARIRRLEAARQCDIAVDLLLH